MNSRSESISRVTVQLALSLAVVLALGVRTARAEDFYLNDGVSDWTADASYKGGKAPTPAQLSGAVLVVAEGVTATLNASDAASIGLVNAADHVYLKAPSSRVVVSAPLAGDEVVISNRMSSAGHGTANFSVTNGCICKTGLGKLKLVEAVKEEAFATRIEVTAGEVHMSANAFNPKYGHVAVSNGAAFYLPTDAKAYCTVAGLWGDGLVTTTGTRTQIRVGFHDVPREEQYSEFRGVLDTEVEYTSGGGCLLSGLNKTRYPLATIFGWQYMGCSNATGLASLPAAEGSPSPVGTSYLRSRDGGGSFAYFGTNDVLLSTAVRYQMKAYGPDISTFDAGANGNVRFTGSWFVEETDKDGRFCVTGSNTTYACVLENPWTLDWTKDGTDRSFELIKSGCGVWRVADLPAWNEGRLFSGPVSILDGTLRVDSLYDVGTNCAVGLGTRLNGKPAIALGSTGTEGTLAYSGDGLSNGVSVATRPATLAGDGRFLNDSGVVPFRYRGVAPALDGRSKTLTLDGSSTLANEVADITDEEGSPIGVTKKGSGTWELAGAQSFHGPLKVEAGTLVVRNTGKFGWFRWTVRETSGKTAVVNCQEFCLYDADGNRQNGGLSVQTNSYAVGPGQAAVLLRHSSGSWLDYGTSGSTYAGWHHLGRLFDNTLNYADRPSGSSASVYRTGWSCHWQDGEKNLVVPTAGDADTYVSVVMRLPETANEVVAYDLVWGNSVNTSPSSWTLEGSADGFSWTLLDEVSDGGQGDDKAFTFKFNSGVNQKDGSAIKNAKGKQISGSQASASSVLDSCSSVAVGDGARLVCVGDPLALKSLRVDANGAGEFENFTLAADGQLDIVNMPKDAGSLVLPVRFSDVGGLENVANWKVSVDGKVRARLSARAANGKIVVDRVGLIVTVR